MIDRETEIRRIPTSIGALALICQVENDSTVGAKVHFEILDQNGQRMTERNAVITERLATEYPQRAVALRDFVLWLKAKVIEEALPS